MLIVCAWGSLTRSYLLTGDFDRRSPWLQGCRASQSTLVPKRAATSKQVCTAYLLLAPAHEANEVYRRWRWSSVLTLTCFDIERCWLWLLPNLIRVDSGQCWLGPVLTLSWTGADSDRWWLVWHWPVLTFTGADLIGADFDQIRLSTLKVMDLILVWT